MECLHGLFDLGTAASKLNVALTHDFYDNRFCIESGGAMPTLELKMTKDELAALAMAAHGEDMTLNAYVNSCLQAAAEHEINRLEKELAESE